MSATFMEMTARSRFYRKQLETVKSPKFRAQLENREQILARSRFYKKQIEIMKSPKFRAQLEKGKQVWGGSKYLNTMSRKIAKRTKILSRRSSPSDSCPFPTSKKFVYYGLSAYYLFEFASGYALFHVHGTDDLHLTSFQSHEKYIKRSDIFTLKAFHPFSSSADALVQMNAISDSKVTPQLKNFLVDNLPKRVDGKASCYRACDNPFLIHNIKMKTGMLIRCGTLCSNVIRGLRMKIHKFIEGLEPKDLGKQQLNLARLYSKQRCTTTVVNSSKAISSSLQKPYVVPHRGRQRCSTMVVKSSKAIASSSLQQFVVVPHRFEGVFIAKGKENFICTRNLVPGETPYGEELIYIQNEDGIKVDYKVWDPLRSKLAAAILCGIKNICVKPGSRVLYLGEICEITISHLSDLVGSDGLVYVVGFSEVVVNMVDKWPNVITIFETSYKHMKYRMVVSMVDVILADIVCPQQVNWIVNNAQFYLRAGGHYMITTTRAINVDLTGQGKDLFATHHEWLEFNPIELVMLEPIMREYVMVVGGFRLLEE